ncbi:MAG: hypothetical protein P8012_16075 [Desulfobacterales bacterium]
MVSFIKYNGDKRLGLDRRQYSYDKHIPERRSGKERRNGFDRKLKISNNNKKDVYQAESIAEKNE